VQGHYKKECPFMGSPPSATIFFQGTIKLKILIVPLFQLKITVIHVGVSWFLAFGQIKWHFHKAICWRCPHSRAKSKTR